MTMKRHLALAACVLAMSLTHISAQTIITPLESQRASVSQRIGVTDISIEYSRPAVKGRPIWGSLVPYDAVWRAGANENTVFTTSHPITVQGQVLPAGRYGLHMIPTAGAWTIIFNKEADAWGSFFYRQADDALRVTVTPVAAGNQELLTYAINDVTEDRCVVSMRWEKLDVRIQVVVDVKDAVISYMRRQLTSLHGFDPDMYASAAAYARSHNLDKEQGKAWAERAYRGNPSFNHAMLLADFEDAAGNSTKAKELRDKGLVKATNAELNLYGYRLLNEKKFPEAIAVLAENTKRFPEDANTWDSLGEAYALSGNKSKAKDSFKKSISMNPTPETKANSEMWLKKLEGM